MIINRLFILLSSFLILTFSHKGVDISKLYSTSVYQCLYNQGFTFAIPRAYHSYGAIDDNAIQNLKNARVANLSTDIYFFPCRGKNATSQANDLLTNIPTNLYGTIWIDVQTNPSTNCSWGTNYASNCAFLKQIALALKARGKKIGYYSTSHFWTQILGNSTACPDVSGDPLWYAHYDKKESYGDFVAFGGWTKPGMKQYVGDTVDCGADVDYNYYP